MFGLLILDLVIWLAVWKSTPKSCGFGVAPVETGDGAWVECPSGGCETPLSEYYPGMKCYGCNSTKDEKIEETLLKQDFEAWWNKERQKDETLTDYLWREGILNPEEYVIVEGMFLTPGNPEDMQAFMLAKNQAYLRQQFNDINFPEGEELLYITWFKMRGCSQYGAEQLMLQGIKPWEFQPDW